MATLFVTVCLPPAASQYLVQALDTVLEPFQSMQGHPAGRDIWDAWRISGGSNGWGFHVRPGLEHDPRLIHDHPGYYGEPLPSEPGMCAGGPRGLLDLDTPHRQVTLAAEQAWDLWHELAAEYPPVRTFTDYFREETVSWDRARELYLDQPIIREFHRIILGSTGRYPISTLLHLLTPDLGAVLGMLPEGMPELARDRTEYIQWQVAHHARRTDLLTLDGWWIDFSAGWAAPSTLGTGVPDPDPDGWQIPIGWFDVIGYLMTLPEDTTVVTLKCHT